MLPGETGLLASPERPQQLAAAIGYMLDEPAEAARMAAAGQRLIGDRFTPVALGAVLDAAYQRRHQPARLARAVTSPLCPTRLKALEDLAWTSP